MLTSLQRFLLWAVLPLGAAQVHATPTLPAPEPPELVYRVDARPPETIFTEGLQTWAARQGRTQRTDLISHVMGSYIEEHPIYTTNWVSTSALFSVAEIFARLRSLDDEDHVWIYDIQPTTQAYFVPWAFADFLQRNPETTSRRALAAARGLEVYGNQEEWAFLGTIQPEAIIQARRYDRVGNQYVDSGVRIPNPAHQPQPRPAPQTANPLDGFGTETPSVIALGYESLPTVPANGTMHETPMSVGMSCLGVAASSSASARKKRTTGGQSYCYDDPQHVVAVNRYTQVRYSPLAFRVHTGDTYCARPNVWSNFYGVDLDACDQAAAQFLYDEHNRLYIRTHGIDWCMTVSPSVVDGGSDAWDYIRLEPCALNSDYQKWHIVDGKIYTHKGLYPVQDWRWALIVSRNKDGYDNTLDPTSMTAGFFNGPSPSQSEQVELQMGWYWNGSKYYSTFYSSSAWGSQYWNRSYYDYKTSRIAYIDLSLVSTLPVSPAQKYCLHSQIDGYNWNWTSWVLCTDDETSPPGAQQWVMKSLVTAYGNPDHVEWLSKSTLSWTAPEQLWVQATGQPAGQYFSATQGSWSNATKVFSIRKNAIRFSPSRDF